jgi:putative chitinase
MIALVQLQKIFPKTTVETLSKYVEPLIKVFKTYEINTSLRQAHFLAQIGHESGGFNFTKENLNYSADALLKVFPKYFNADSAASHARNPQMIANRVYSNRMGNGDVASNDGFTYRGRGLIQLTGKTNYTAFGKAVGLDLAKVVPYLETPEGAAMSAGWFWDTNKLNAKADADNIQSVTKTINGGTNGMDDRMAILARAKAALIG